MKENTFKYIGYGFVGSKKSRKEIELKSTKAYKALRAAFLDSITIEVDDPQNTSRKVLREIIVENLNFGDKGFAKAKDNIVIVVPTAETLGGTYEEATSTYSVILQAFHIIILNRPDLSTCTLQGEVVVERNDFEKIHKLEAEFACARMTNRGRKAISINAKFRKVFWNWQNYYIDTQDAIDLLGCSRATLYSLSKEFIMSYVFTGIYSDEYNNLENYTDKPIRGIVLDDDTIEVLIHIQRTVGEFWSPDFVSDALISVPTSKHKFAVTKDYIRLRLNYQYGRSAMVAATRKYSKGKDYIRKLKKELENM